MAVAFKDEKFGSADIATKVADPIVLSTSLPRFMTPGDTVMVPVTITNTSNRVANGKASIQINGGAKVISGNLQSISVNPGSETNALFEIVASPVIGIANIKVDVSTLGENFPDETEISIRPASTLQKISASGSYCRCHTVQLNIPQGDFIPESFKYELIVSRSPVAEIADQLRYLVQYPYGCTEQTVSAAFPQLYYGDFADAMGLNNGSKQNANY